MNIRAKCRTFTTRIVMNISQILSHKAAEGIVATLLLIRACIAEMSVYYHDDGDDTSDDKREEEEHNSDNYE